VPARKRKRRLIGESTAEGAERLSAERPGHVWAFDFQHDATTDGRKLKFLNVVDEFTREALAEAGSWRQSGARTATTSIPTRHLAQCRRAGSLSSWQRTGGTNGSVNLGLSEGVDR